MNKAFYDCQVWDSMTGEWARVSVTVPEAPGSDYEQLGVLGADLNAATSEAMDENRDAWILMDTHVLQASGEEVVMVQLRARDSDDISVIMAVRTEFESEDPRDMGWVGQDGRP